MSGSRSDELTLSWSVSSEGEAGGGVDSDGDGSMVELCREVR